MPDTSILIVMLPNQSNQFQLTPRQHRRRLLLPLILAWPIVVLAGLVLNRIAESHAPVATVAVLWLLILAYVIERMHNRWQ